jgi:hypothetical protein
MKVLELTPAEVATLTEFVQEVLTICNYDDTGVTDDLIEPAAVCAEILQMNNKNEEEDDKSFAYSRRAGKEGRSD